MLKNLNKGFSLIELVIALAIAAILLLIGLPSFREAFSDTRRATVYNDLMGSIALTRSEALRKNRLSIICASNDGVTCNGAGWDDGWIVFVDNNNNYLKDVAEPVLRKVPAFTTTTVATQGNVGQKIVFTPDGSLGKDSSSGTLTVGSIRLCSPQAVSDSSRAREMIVLSSGQVVNSGAAPSISTCSF